MNLKKYKRQLQESSWLLGICENGYEDLKVGQIHWIDNGEYKGKKWFADPFILEYDDERITLLVEEFDYKVHRGRVARLFVDRKSWKVTDCKIILDLPTHLSFPMIWRENGNIYVCPENYKSGQWKMYEYHTDSNALTFVKTLIREPLTDAILHRDDSGYYIFSTCHPKPNGKELKIWKSSSLDNDFSEYSKMSFPENIARNAGMVFKNKHTLMRPSQECDHAYGHAITFQKVIKTDSGFNFEEEYRYFSNHAKYKFGAHTYNQHSGGMAVIDVKGFRYMSIGKWMWTLQRLVIKLKLKEEIWLK